MLLVAPALFWAGCGKGEIDELTKPRPTVPGAAEPAPSTGQPPAPGTNVGGTPTPTPTTPPTGAYPPSVIDTPPPPPVPPPTGEPAQPMPTTPPTGMPPTGMPPTGMPGPIGQPLPPPRVSVSELEMPAAVHSILSSRCGGCHTYGERDPAGWGSAMDLSRMIASDIVVPGDPDKSRLCNRVAVRADMPYNGAAPDLARRCRSLRAWIANLQPAGPETPRTTASRSWTCS